jgi:transglutaminase-like putative cysteine protease
VTVLRVGCELGFDVERAAEVVLQVTAARRAGVAATERFEVRLDERALPVTVLDAPDGGRLHVVRADPGRLRVAYEARVAVEAEAAAVGALERVVALRASRYCPSDRLLGFAARQFGPVDPLDPGAVAAAVGEVVSFVHERTQYHPGTSTATTDAAETLLAGAGVCRDFAHLVATLARALGVPARVVAVYAPGLSPMDFHAVAEVAVDGVWRLVDATRLAPRASMLRIATGPDAAATAFATVPAGTAELSTMEVLAVVEGDLPVDDGVEPITLA